LRVSYTGPSGASFEDFSLKLLTSKASGFTFSFLVWFMNSFGLFACFILAIVRWDINRFSFGKIGERASSILFCSCIISFPLILIQTILGLFLFEKVPDSWRDA